MPPIGDDLYLHLSGSLLLLYNVFVNVRILHLSLILLWTIVTCALLHVGVDRDKFNTAEWSIEVYVCLGEGGGDA